MVRQYTAVRRTRRAPIRWAGTHRFFIGGTSHDHDTLRMVTDRPGMQASLALVLPTLCIPFADAHFANAIGGVQARYPDAAAYGPAYFPTPVVIRGEAEVEKFTWIRGAEQVTVGPQETTIVWPGWRTLVIPVVLISAGAQVAAVLNVPEISIPVSQPFTATVTQYADGRHVGGIQCTKRHPDWRAAPPPQVYDLWVRVIDGQTHSPLVQARVHLFTWDAETNGGQFVREATWYTNTMGVVDVSGLPCSAQKLVRVEHEPWLPQTWHLRPLPGQKVRRTFRLRKEPSGA